MKIILIYNKNLDKVISKLGDQNKEIYHEKIILKIEAVFRNLGFDIHKIDGNLDLFDNLMEIAARKDVLPFVFNLAYGIQGESRYSHIPSILEMMGLPFLGAGPLGHALAQNKIISKIIMRKHQIPTPAFRELMSADPSDLPQTFPVILKPAMGAGSYGLKVVHHSRELKQTAGALFDEYDQSLLAEQFISGREFALGLWGNGHQAECLPLVEIGLDASTLEIYTHTKKRYNQKPKTAPADVPHHLLEQMQQKALQVFRLLRLKDYARVDIRMDEQQQFYFLEVNSMASLGTTGSFFQAAQTAGYSFDQMILKLLDIAIGRYSKDPYHLREQYDSIIRNKTQR